MKRTTAIMLILVAVLLITIAVSAGGEGGGLARWFAALHGR